MLWSITVRRKGPLITSDVLSYFEKIISYPWTMCTTCHQICCTHCSALKWIGHWSMASTLPWHIGRINKQRIFWNLFFLTILLWTLNSFIFWYITVFIINVFIEYGMYYYYFLCYFVTDYVLFICFIHLFAKKWSVLFYFMFLFFYFNFFSLFQFSFFYLRVCFICEFFLNTLLCILAFLLTETIYFISVLVLGFLRFDICLFVYVFAFLFYSFNILIILTTLFHLCLLLFYCFLMRLFYNYYLCFLSFVFLCDLITFHALSCVLFCFFHFVVCFALFSFVYIFDIITDAFFLSYFCVLFSLSFFIILDLIWCCFF